jgi:hypothetical protein
MLLGAACHLQIASADNKVITDADKGGQDDRSWEYFFWGDLYVGAEAPTP